MKQLVNIKKKLPGGQNENTQLIKSTFILVPTAFKKQVTPVYDYVVCVFFLLNNECSPISNDLYMDSANLSVFALYCDNY